jgi:LigXa C-terminal domain like
VLWPIAFYLGEQIEWRVPVDDENTLSIAWFYNQPPKDDRPYEQKRVPTWESPIKDENGNWITSHVINQDIVAWVGQGRIADRTKEYLAASDRGIMMMRRRYFEEMKRVEAGKDPKWIVRDPAIAKCVPLPFIGRTKGSGDLTLEQWISHPFLKGRLKDHRQVPASPRTCERSLSAPWVLRDCQARITSKRPTSLPRCAKTAAIALLELNSCYVWNTPLPDTEVVSLFGWKAAIASSVDHEESGRRSSVRERPALRYGIADDEHHRLADIAHLVDGERIVGRRKARPETADQRNGPPSKSNRLPPTIPGRLLIVMLCTCSHVVQHRLHIQPMHLRGRVTGAYCCAGRSNAIDFIEFICR